MALLEEEGLVAESYLNCGLTHSATLMKMAQELLSRCGRTAAQLDAVACAAGPGSFTGVRIGVAAAKGLAWGCELPCCGVSTLEAMAHRRSCSRAWFAAPWTPGGRRSTTRCFSARVAA